MIPVKDYNFKQNISTIEGKLTVRIFYGPPAYGENPDTDVLYKYLNKHIEIKGFLFERVLGHAHQTDVE